MKTTASRKKHQDVKREDHGYMTQEHVDEFRCALLRMLKQCEKEMAEANEAVLAVRVGNERSSDHADMSQAVQSMEETQIQVARLSKRKAEIKAALRRLETGDYGYCEDTGEEIGLARLRANPLARLSIDAAIRREHLARLHRKN